MALDTQGNEVGKLFVGGLHQSTSTDGLRTYFSKFGEIDESIVMMDNRTGRSRGFGYVKFKESSAVDDVLLNNIHVIDNKEVDPKKCNINMRGKNRRSLKIFVGGIAFEHDEETIRSFFETYGTVTDVNLLSNPGRPRHRGFAFVGFENEEVVKKLIKLHYVNLKGKQVEIKPMEPPNSQKPNSFVSQRSINISLNAGRPVRGGGRMNPFNSPNTLNNNWSHWTNSNEPSTWNPSHEQPTHSWNQSMWNNSTIEHGNSSHVAQGSTISNGIGWGTHLPNQNNGLHLPWTQPTNSCTTNRQSSETHSDQLQQWHRPRTNGQICPLESPYHQFSTPINGGLTNGGLTNGGLTNGQIWNGQQSNSFGWNGFNPISKSAPKYGIEMEMINGTSLWNEQIQSNDLSIANSGNVGQSFSTGLFTGQSVPSDFCLPSNNNNTIVGASDWQTSTISPAASLAHSGYCSQHHLSGLCK